MKENLAKRYNELKDLLGKTPTIREFRSVNKNCDMQLYDAFEKNGFTKLQIYCGDVPKRFGKDKSDLETILKQWATLARDKKELPNQFDWELKNLKPTISGIKSSHQLKWSDLPAKFAEHFVDDSQWTDIMALIPKKDIASDVLKESECFVYLNRNGKGHFKIGISINPSSREKTLMAQDPQIETIAKKKYINKKIAGAIEKSFHQLYSHKRIRGEWFLLDENDLDELIATLNN